MLCRVQSTCVDSQVHYQLDDIQKMPDEQRVNYIPQVQYVSCWREQTDAMESETDVAQHKSADFITIAMPTKLFPFMGHTDYWTELWWTFDEKKPLADCLS